MAYVPFDNESRARRTFIEHGVKFENGATAIVGSIEVIYLNGAFYFADANFGELYSSVSNATRYIPETFREKTA